MLSDGLRVVILGQNFFSSFDPEDVPKALHGNLQNFRILNWPEMFGHWTVKFQMVITRSFSGLVQGIDFEGKDFDAVVESREAGMLSENSIADEIFEFPSGAQAGNFMHEVFERIDFTDKSNWEEIIKSACTKFGYDSHRWYRVIFKMIENVTGEKLSDGFSLSEIPLEDRIEEMEFHFPTRSGVFSELCKSLPEDSLLHQYLQGVSSEEILEIESSSFLKGLMIMVFRCDGKYYLLDWKSNRLNGQRDGYFRCYSV